jgi:hypothetical protein
MFKKLAPIVIAALAISSLCVTPISGETLPEKEVRFIEKVKAGIAQLGTGPKARIEVKLRDKRTLKGYVSEISEDYFAVTDTTGAITKVSYPQVQKVKGHKLSDNTKRAIIVGAALGFLIFVLVLAGGS